MDFAATFWNCECVCVLCEKAFISKYQRWCKKYSYNFSEDRALDIYASARSHFDVMPKTDTARTSGRTGCLSTPDGLCSIGRPENCKNCKMRSWASSRPEYPVVMKIFRCWSIARLTTYGGDWRCPPFPLQDGVGGFCRY